MSSFLQTLRDIITLSPETTTLAIIIFISALCAYVFWYLPEQKKLMLGLNSISQTLEKEHENIDELKNDVVENISSEDSNIKESWVETEKRIFKITQNGNKKYVMQGIPRDIWNTSALLSKRFNLSLAESVPNLLVGVGLFFTESTKVY